MNLQTILVVILILALLGALPVYPYSHAWGWYPPGGVLILIILILLFIR